MLHGASVPSSLSCFLLLCFLVVEGKRSPGVQVVWVARNRFAVLDKTRQVGVGTAGHAVSGVDCSCACLSSVYGVGLRG